METRSKQLFICRIVHFFSILQVTLCSSSGECYGPRTVDQLARVLWGDGSNYTDVDTRPNLSKLLAENPMADPSLAEPDVIGTQITIASIKSLDQKRGEVEVHAWLELYWKDYRLAYNSLTNCGNHTDTDPFKMRHFSNIWQPYTYVTNSVSKPIQNAASFFVSPDGTVTYDQELTMNLSCKLKYDSFPKDTQTCKIIISPYADTISKMIMNLSDNPLSKYDNADVDMADTIEWDPDNYDAIIKNITYQTDVYSYAIFSFTLKRNYDHYIHFVILPVVLIVIMAYASFFIDRGAAPARVTLSSVSFLTITNHIGGQLKSLPNLGIQDVWLLQFMLTSQLFTFYAVIEYVICNYLFRVEKQLKEIEKEAKRRKMTLKNSPEREPSLLHSHDSIDAITVVKDDLLAVGKIHKIGHLLLKKDGTLLIKDENVDMFSRIFYPVAYVVCTLVIYFLMHNK